MKNEENKEETIITLANYANTVALFCSPLELTEHNCHMTMGMIEESEELVNAVDNVNAKEELGDLLWFVSQYCRHNNIDFSTACIIAQSAASSWKPNYSAPWSKLLTLTKKELAYGFIPEYDARAESIHNVVTFAMVVMIHNEYELIDVLQTNFNKLNTRYKTKAFESSNAMNRDLAVEREVLES